VKWQKIGYYPGVSLVLSFDMQSGCEMLTRDTCAEYKSVLIGSRIAFIKRGAYDKYIIMHWSSYSDSEICNAKQAMSKEWFTKYSKM